MRSVALLVFVACTTPIETPPPEAPPEGGVIFGPNEGIKDQGRYLLGELADPVGGGTYHLHAGQQPLASPNAPAVTRVVANNGVLTAFNGGTQLFSGAHVGFVDMELAVVGQPNKRIKITQAFTNGTYALELHASGGAQPYCEVGGAVATAGRWTRTGAHEVADTITLSCDDGVITKCLKWGYTPNAAPGTGPAQLDGWQTHLACTRMARADRCGNGDSKTLEGTSIMIRDNGFSGAQPDINDGTVAPLAFPTDDPPPPDRYWFEAAWGVDGALCLSRERWKSMPLEEDECMADPRFDAGAKYCDEVNDILTTGLIFNGSMIGQLYLNLWRHHTSNAYLATVRGLPSDILMLAEPPFPGYRYVQQLGLLMRNPPDSLVLPGDPNADPDLASVSLWSGGTDRVVAATAPSGAYTVEGWEGYVYVDDGGGTRPTLRLYQKGADYVSSTSAPAANWIDRGVIGYIDP